MNKYRYIALITTVAFFGLIAGKALFHKIVEAELGDVPLSERPQPVRDEEQIAAKYGELPIYFEPNVGQSDRSVRYLAHGQGYSLALKSNEAVIALRRAGKGKQSAAQTAFSMKIEGANASPEIEGVGETGARSNYLIGNDPSAWQTDVPNFSSVRYRNLLDGVDAVFYGNGRQLEYDFVVQGQS